MNRDRSDCCTLVGLKTLSLPARREMHQLHGCMASHIIVYVSSKSRSEKLRLALYPLMLCTSAFDTDFFCCVHVWVWVLGGGGGRNIFY